jgi:hypothetical protein
MFAALAGLIMTVSGLGTVALADGPLREPDLEAAWLAPADSADEAARGQLSSTSELDAQDLRRVLRLQRLELAAGLDPAVSMSRDWRADLRQRSALREVLGYDRWRRLGDARFQLQLRQLQGYSEHRDLRDLPIIYEQVEDSLSSNFRKLARDYVEQRLGLDEMIERKRERLRSRLHGDGDGEESSSGLRISPRLSLGSNSYLGAKFQLRSSPFLRRFGLRVSHSFDSDEMALKLMYEKGEQRFFVEHRFDDPDRGDTTAFSLRLGF